MNTKLTRKGYTLIKNEIKDNILNKIKEDLNVAPQVVNLYSNLPPERFKVYKKNANIQ